VQHESQFIKKLTQRFVIFLILCVDTSTRKDRIYVNAGIRVIAKTVEFIHFREGPLVEWLRGSFYKHGELEVAFGH
jgi:hypothetical protein